MKRGFVSPARAASMLGVHRNTTYAWALRAVAGEPSKLQVVERHPITGYLAIPLSEIRRLKNGGPKQ